MNKNTEEYLRRNLIVSKSLGVEAGLKTMFRRAPKRTPKWMTKIMESEIVKARDIVKEIVKHRDEIQKQ